MIRHPFYFLLGLLLFLSACASSDKGAHTADTASLSATDSLYLQRGQAITAATFDTLSKALTAAMQREGISGALQYCNVNAYPITSHYANAEGVLVRRTSLRYRNPLNQPDSLEQQLFQSYAQAIQAGNTNATAPRLVRHADEIHFFKPILLQPLCVVCHGQPGRNITSETSQAINQLYPADQATNFAVGDLRGLWHVRFIQE
jgi:hypothetical protein